MNSAAFDYHHNHKSMAPHIDSPDSVISLLNRISNSWNRRAQVKTSNLEINPIDTYDLCKADFSEELLPFKDHPYYLNAPFHIKQQILSCGWIIYNQKTLAIETEIVNPVCVDMLFNKIPGAEDFVSKQIISETMTDESYHVLLVTNAIGITSHYRQLDLSLPKFNLINQMKKYQAAQDASWKKTLTQLATAIVSEIFISDYLKLLSDNDKIQPFNRMTVATHKKDETVHANIFKQLTKNIYCHLNTEQKLFFAKVLAKPVRWFADRELLIWKSALEQIGFKYAEKMITDCTDINNRCIDFIDYSELLSLAKEVSIMNISEGLESFQTEGLI